MENMSTIFQEIFNKAIFECGEYIIGKCVSIDEVKKFKSICTSLKFYAAVQYTVTTIYSSIPLQIRAVFFKGFLHLRKLKNILVYIEDQADINIVLESLSNMQYVRFKFKSFPSSSLGKSNLKRYQA